MPQEPIIADGSPYRTRVVVEVEIVPTQGAYTTAVLDNAAGQAIGNVLEAWAGDSFSYDLQHHSRMRVVSVGVPPEPDPSQADLQRMWSDRQYTEVARVLNRMDPCATALFLLELPGGVTERSRLTNLLMDLKIDDNAVRFDL